LTQYVILQTNSGVSGTFSNVTSNLAFLTPSLTYGATNVFLDLASNSTVAGSNGFAGAAHGTRLQSQPRSTVVRPRTRSSLQC